MVEWSPTAEPPPPPHPLRDAPSYRAPTGGCLGEIGFRGTGPGQFIYPRGVAIVRSKLLVVAERQRVQVGASVSCVYACVRRGSACRSVRACPVFMRACAPHGGGSCRCGRFGVLCALALRAAVRVRVTPLLLACMRSLARAWMGHA